MNIRDFKLGVIYVLDSGDVITMLTNTRDSYEYRYWSFTRCEWSATCGWGAESFADTPAVATIASARMLDDRAIMAWPDGSGRVSGSAQRLVDGDLRPIDPVLKPRILENVRAQFATTCHACGGPMRVLFTSAFCPKCE